MQLIYGIFVYRIVLILVQAELASSNMSSTKSAKLLTEKLALSHEIASLKPELEHFRSQAASYQSTLSEKLSLQRELNTLEVELETERRATQKVLAKQISDAEQEGKYEAQLAQLRKELSKERKAREGLERESEKMLESFEEKKAALEGKLEAMRDKLRTTKAQLKEVKLELQQAKASEEAATLRAEAVQHAEKPARTARKRKAVTVELPEPVGTPDGGKEHCRAPNAKGNRRVSTLPGDKSAFSITPFLNRTASLAPDSPVGEPPQEPDEEILPAKSPNLHQQLAAADTTPAAARKKAKKSKKAALGTSAPGNEHILTSATAGKQNIKASKGKKGTVAPVLSQVVEENEENEQPKDSKCAHEPGTSEDQSRLTTVVSTVTGEPERGKKKRKLVGAGSGKTLFDEEEGEQVRPLGKSLFGGAKGVPAFSRSLLGGKAIGSSRQPSFSPLKKDRKTIAA